MTDVVGPKDEEFLSTYLNSQYAAYQEEVLHKAWYQCLVGQKAIHSKKKSKPSKRLVVLTNHRFVSVAHSRFGKKPSVEFDFHWYDLRVLDNNTANRLRFAFAGKDKEVEVQTNQEDVIIRIVLTEIARISKNFVQDAMPVYEIAQNRVAALTGEVDCGIAEGLIPCYRAWCAYYRTTVSQDFITFVGDLVARGSQEMPLHECPGIETSSPTTVDLLPVCRSLAHNTYFKSVALSDVKRPKLWRSLATMVQYNQSVTKLVLHNCDIDPKDGKSFFGALQTNIMNKLTIFDVQGSKIDKDTAAGIADALESFVHGFGVLNFADCALSGTSLCELFSGMVRNLAASMGLAVLYLDGARFDEDSSDLFAYWLGKMASYGNVRRISVANCSGLEIAQAFRPLALGGKFSLQYLDLSGLKMDTSFLASQIIGSSLTLQELHISNCHVSSEDFGVIVQAIAATSSITMIKLVADGNPIGVNPAAFLTPLHGARAITHLSLKDCSFSHQSASQVVDTILATLDQLQSLAVGGVGTSKKATSSASEERGFAESISILLNQHPTLRELELSDIALNAYAWRYCWASLEQARITRLVLNGVGMGDVGISMITEALRRNTSIGSLEVDSNGMSLNGLLSLRALLRVTDRLYHFPVPRRDLTKILDGCSGALWQTVQETAAELQRLVDDNRARQAGEVEWPLKAFSIPQLVTPQDCPPVVEITRDITAEEKPPKYRDKKTWQAWRSRMEADLNEYSRAAAAGGYVANTMSPRVPQSQGYVSPRPNVSPRPSQGGYNGPPIATVGPAAGSQYADKSPRFSTSPRPPAASYSPPPPPPALEEPPALSPRDDDQWSASQNAAPPAPGGAPVPPPFDAEEEGGDDDDEYEYEYVYVEEGAEEYYDDTAPPPPPPAF